MPVPNTFANATTTIPLSDLDNNFATPITIGNTAVQLGNTVTTLNNMTLANVTITSGSSTNVTTTGGSISNVTITNANITSVSPAFPNSFLANSTATLGNATVTLGSTTSTVGNLTVANVTVTDYTESQVNIGNSSTTQTIALSNGTVQTVTLTANCTFTMPTAVAGKSFSVLIKSGAGGFTGTFSNVKWTSNTAPTITSTASRLDVLTFVSDGTNWYGNYAQNYTV
jgi:hypothetical protein